MRTRATRLGFLGPIHHPGPTQTSLQYFDRRWGTRKPHRQSSTLYPATRYGSRNQSKYEMISATTLMLNSPSRRYIRKLTIFSRTSDLFDIFVDIQPRSIECIEIQMQ
jgi:hypothetical protein